MNEQARLGWTEDPARKMILAFYGLYRGLRRIRRTLATQHGVSLLQLQVIELLNDGRSKKMGDIAVDLAVTRATASDAVAVAERKGLVVRMRDAEDKRVVHVTITSAGRQLAEQVEQQLASRFVTSELATADDHAVALRAMLVELRRLHLDGVMSTVSSCLTCSHMYTDGELGGLRCDLFKLELTDSCLRVDCPGYEPIPAGPMGQLVSVTGSANAG